MRRDGGLPGTGKCEGKTVYYNRVFYRAFRVQVPSGANVLLECLSNLTANELYRADGAGEKTKEAILSGVQSLLEQAASLIIVTNEIFVPRSLITRRRCVIRSFWAA